MPVQCETVNKKPSADAVAGQLLANRRRVPERKTGLLFIQQAAESAAGRAAAAEHAHDKESAA